MSDPVDRRRILAMHFTIAIVVPGFLALAWWQLNRALSGNSLSWAYVFEWPAFAGYAIYMWRKLTREVASAGSPVADSGVTSAARDLPADVLGPEDPPCDGVYDAHDARSSTVDAVSSPSGEEEAGGEEVDEELAKYNEYLAALNASGRRKHW